MGKRIINLYGDDEVVAIAKSKGINLSSWFREMLSIEVEIMELSDAVTKEELIAKLKSRMALLSDELKLKDLKNRALEREIKELKIKKEDDSDRYETIQLKK